MSPSAIVYASATGFTRRYADLLSERTRPALLCAGHRARPGPGRGGSLSGLAVRRWDQRPPKGPGPLQGAGGVRRRHEPAGTAYTDQVRAQNHLENLPFFYLRGGYAPERLTGLYRPMMSLMSRMVSKASAEDEGARAMQEAFAKGGDWVSAEQLSPVLDALTE